MEINRIAIAPYCAADMYILVDNIEAYPDFLPWCLKTEVFRADDFINARLFINYHGINTSFMTKNRHYPTSEISMELVEGPLSTLFGKWTFTPIEDYRCRVELTLQYTFKNLWIEKIFSRLFSVVFDRFTADFMQRAKAVYGEKGKNNIMVELVCAESANDNPKALILPQLSTVAKALAKADIAVKEEGLVSIYGRQCGMDTVLADGDRIEINTLLAHDPRYARRQRTKS